MKRSSLVRACAALALAATFGSSGLAQMPYGVRVTGPGGSPMSTHVTLGLDKSTVIDLERPAADVVITNAEIADAVVQSRQRIIFRGVATGQTNAFVYDERGNEILNLEIVVEADLTALNDLIVRHVPTARVEAEAVNGSVVLSGHVDSVADSETIKQLVELYSAGFEDAQIVNMMSVAAKDQVLLEVRIVEMQRSFLKQLGINPTGEIGFGDFANLVEKQLFAGDPPVDTGTTALVPGLPFSNSAEFGFTPSTPPASGFSGSIGYTNYVETDLQSEVGLAIDALERVGIARTLAEPNITAVSGEAGRFLAGGEFPIPTAPDEFGVTGIEFKEYGVGLGFTPIVLSENRISLRVSTEVSELTNQGSVAGVPALIVRKVESTVELPSGQSMMLGGLIQSRTRQELEQIPGLKNIPVIGALYQSRDFANDETELVIIITPYLVDPTQRGELRSPADGFANAGDLRTIFFGKLNRLYGENGEPVSADEYRAPVGFIEE